MEIEIWGGIECTLNRVGDKYFDQIAYSGHYQRAERDISQIASLGFKMLRYPVLWEKHVHSDVQEINWSFTERSLNKIRLSGMTPIVGLVHHGCGPRHVNFFDGSFELGLAKYASKVAEKFPWIEYYTPVNEPLTTARFSGLYGHWYPHKKNDFAFYKILLSQCKAIVMAMNAISRINPRAKLIQTEDLSKCYSTPLLKYQADFENIRRWLTYDLLCGKVDETHFMWKELIRAGIIEEDILFFLTNKCIPHIAGFNYYITSERFISEKIKDFSTQYHGGNGLQNYADIETVLSPVIEENGPSKLLREAYMHINLPIAITECHMHATREDQLRWLAFIVKVAIELKKDKIDIKAITVWALLGSWGWDKLVTEPFGTYESGAFDVSSGVPRITALATFIREICKDEKYNHPILFGKGWWQKEKIKLTSETGENEIINARPILIVGKISSLRNALIDSCIQKDIHYVIKDDFLFNLKSSANLEDSVKEINPWCIINVSDYPDIEDKEMNNELCSFVNCDGPVALAEICKKLKLRYLSFSSSAVFDGNERLSYIESDKTCSNNTYGLSKASAEEKIFAVNPTSLIIRTGNLFGPSSVNDIFCYILGCLHKNASFVLANDALISLTYLPDIGDIIFNLILDGDQGVFHIINQHAVSIKQIASKIALLSGLNTTLPRNIHTLRKKSRYQKFLFNILKTETNIILPSSENAIERWLLAIGGQNTLTNNNKIL